MKYIKINESNLISFYDTKWNDAVFGYKTNEISEIKFDSIENGIKLLNMFDNECNSNDVKYSAIRVNSNSNDTKFILEKSDYYNIETSIKVESNIKKINENSFFEKFKFSLEAADIKSLPFIKNISDNEFKHGRFFEDSNIDLELAKKRNRNWIDDLYKSSNLLVGKTNGEIFSFMFYSLNNCDVNLQLGGVSSKYSHLAYPFWYKIIMKLKNDDIKNINAIISANNISIINLYSHFGFRFSNSFIGYRKFRK